MKKNEYVTPLLPTEEGSELSGNQNLANEISSVEDACNNKAIKKKSSQRIKSVAYPSDTTLVLENMMGRYGKAGRAQNVSFRKLVDWLKVGERATHYVHTYPAKLLPQIAHFFLAAQQLSKPGDIVLDPFGGSGTVALEAILAGRKAIFADVNPLARLIAAVKTVPIDPEDLRHAHERITRRYLHSKSSNLLSPSVVNIDYWYSTEAIEALGRIKNAIDRETAGPIRDFLLVSFSGACRKVSRADPRLSVPVRLKDGDKEEGGKPQNVWGVFDDQVQSNIRRMQNFVAYLAGSTIDNLALCAGSDARSLQQPTSTLQPKNRKLRRGTVSLIITSPPYAGAQKYIRASSLNIGWLGLAEAGGLKGLENSSIGREHYPKALCAECPMTGIPNADRLIKRVYAINPLRSVIIATYLNEMNTAIAEMVRVLKPGGHLVLVIGNNEVCGIPFKSSEYLLTLCERHGLTAKLRLIDEIKSRGLMTKRNKTASVITREWVLLLEKKESINFISSCDAAESS